jgi:drug/metabolite transporter (DMT)-like permease
VTGQHGAFLQPKVLVPFVVITLIWGSTWIIIKDQLGVVPPAWSVTYRYVIAASAMFAYAAWRRLKLRLDREGHLLALAFGIPQFFLNFNFVYAAERFVTSGIVSVVFALLLVPNSLLARAFLKHRLSARFVAGSALAVGGVFLLFVHEVQSAPGRAEAVVAGIGLTLLGMLCASFSNVLQATRRVRSRPVATMVAWGMLYGTIANAALAFFLYGPPVFEARAGYWIGLVYLGLFASALAFTFYFGIIRIVGPGRAAYSSVLIPIVAMGFSTVFEAYRWSLLAVAGGLCALAGLLIALGAGRRQAGAAGPPVPEGGPISAP